MENKMRSYCQSKKKKQRMFDKIINYRRGKLLSNIRKSSMHNIRLIEILDNDEKYQQVNQISNNEATLDLAGVIL